MIYLVLFFMEIVALYFLSRFVSKTLSKFVSINLMSFIFFPGVIVHELAHFFAAMILFVPVGNMEFMPKKTDGGVKLGSIEIAKTDPIRRSIIGFAPVFMGILIIAGAVFLFSVNIAFLQNQSFYIYIAVILVLVYLLFAVGNTMFSSSKDMEGALEVLIAVLIIFGAIYLLGFRLPLSYFNAVFTKEVSAVIQKSAIFLLAPIIIDLFILGTIKLITNIRSRRF